MVDAVVLVFALFWFWFWFGVFAPGDCCVVGAAVDARFVEAPSPGGVEG